MAKESLNRYLTRNEEGNKYELEVDLGEIFGADLSDRPALKEAIAQQIIDRIVERTESGIDRHNRGFKSYSGQYVESDEFQAFGKREGQVNLTLTGNMLGLLDVKEISGNKIVIGWDEPEEAEKAHGHISGNVGKKRDFLGLPVSEIEKIREEFKSEIRTFETDEESFNERPDFTAEFAFELLKLLREG